MRDFYAVGRAAAGTSGLVLIALLVGCGSSDSDSYYPVNEGRTWEYNAYLYGGTSNAIDLTVSMLGPRTLSGTKVATRKYDFGHHSSFEFIETASDKVCLRGEQKAGSDTTTDLGEFQCFLKLPLEQGQTWTMAADTDLTAGHSLTLTAQVVSMDDTVTVPAGTFEHCVKVEATGQEQIEFQMYRKFTATLSVNETSWYVKGVGLVKSSWTSIINGNIMVAPVDQKKSVALELVSYK